MSRNADRQDPQEMLARIDRMEQGAEQLLAKLEGLQAELGAGAVEVWSEDGLVRVKLDNEGCVDEIELHEYAMRYRSTLGEHIRQTVIQAKQVHADKTAELAQRLLGDTIDLQGILNQFRS
ncbi:YbaB/EbfC family nucleoid-associated protein [Glycomyces sp. NPDC048151]|uniref:YbaB/EbfC family nucleoid-associated protein n=1 Tax=Glycomyces sp. NPDC048151 TaxID=3364002 RepID=UPI0037144220